MPYDYIEEYQKQNDDTIWEFRDKDAQSKIDISSTETDYANPLTFETMQAQLAKNTKIKLEPIQDLHGYDKPWVGGAGKNLIPMTVDKIKAVNTGGIWSGNVYTYRDGTVSILTDSDNNVIGLKINGSFSRDSIFYITGHGISFSQGQYILNSVNASAYAVLQIYSYTQSANIIRCKTDEDTVGSILENEDVECNIYIHGNYSFSNVILTPMLRLATVTDSTFEPYTNICPISGHDQIDILRYGEDLANVEFEQGAISYQEGQSYSYCKVSDDTRIRCKKLIALNPNINYTLKLGNSNYRYVIQTFDSQQHLYYSASYSNQWKDTDVTFFGAPYIAIAIKKSDESNISVSEYINANIKLLEQDDISNLSIDLPSTVYGGVLDLESGELVVNWKSVDLSTLGWFYNTHVSRLTFETDVNNRKYDAYRYRMILPQYTFYNGSPNDMPDKSYTCSNNSTVLYIRDTAFNGELNDFIASLDNMIAVYELATPYTLHLTPHQLSLLKSQNTITTSQYTQIKVTYRNGVFATLEELSDLDTNVKDIADKFNALGLSVVDGKLCQTYNT